MYGNLSLTLPATQRNCLKIVLIALNFVSYNLQVGVLLYRD